MPKPRFSKPARSKAGSFSFFCSLLRDMLLNTGTAVVGTGLAAAAGVGFAEDRVGLRGAAADAARGHRAGAPPIDAAGFAAAGFAAAGLAAGFAARCAGSRDSRGAASSSDLLRPPSLASTGDIPDVAAGAAGRAGGAATFEGAAAAGVFAGAAGAGALPGESIGGAAGRAGTAGAAGRARTGAAAGEAGRVGVGAIADGAGAAAGAGPFAATAARLARRDARFDAGAVPVSEGRGS